jgi:hypothetical protein
LAANALRLRSRADHGRRLLLVNDSASRDTSLQCTQRRRGNRE